MHLSLPLFNFTQWKDKCASYSFTTKKLTYSMCQVSLAVKYTIVNIYVVQLDLNSDNDIDGPCNLELESKLSKLIVHDCKVNDRKYYC